MTMLNFNTTQRRELLLYIYIYMYIYPTCLYMPVIIGIRSVCVHLFVLYVERETGSGLRENHWYVTGSRIGKC